VSTVSKSIPNFLISRGRNYSLGGLAGLVILISAIPLFFVLSNSLQLSLDQWVKLWSTRLVELLWNTLSLSFLVAVCSLIMGVGAAWWISRYEFVGRKIAIWLMILPLTVPTYVFAHIYTILFEDDGWIGALIIGVFGSNDFVPDIYTIGGTTMVLSLAGFSYVFLLTNAALSNSTKTLEEAAIIHGANPLQVFLRVNLPLLRPAIAASTAVVVLHTLSDFGAVSMLQFQTFTLSIYLQMSGRFDYQSAAGLSLVLVVLSLTFLILERFFRNRQQYYASRQSRVYRRKTANRTVTLLIWMWLGLIALFSFGLPIAWMLKWTVEAWSQDLIQAEFWQYSFNSLLIATIAASLAIVVALPISLFNARSRSRLSSGLLQLSSIGFVLPGPVIALGIMAFILAQLPLLYGGLGALIFALIIRFLPLAVQSQDAALQQVTPTIEQAGRSLGAGPIENLRRVILPMIKGGMASAWVLVFIDTLKELPATLILRPTGFDTLPVRIWIEASEEMLELAAPAALMLVIGTLPVLWILMMNKGSQNP